MNRIKKLLLILAGCLCVFASGVAIKSIAVKARSEYEVVKIHDQNMKTVIGNSSNIYSEPVSLKAKVVGNTNDLANKEVNVIAKVSAHFQTFYKIKRAGKVYGWVNATSLKTPTQYVLPFKYISQLTPTYAPSGCEAASLQMALSTKGLSQNVSYKKFLDGIPRTSSAKHGYDANPYKKGAGATIYAAAMAKYARKYGANAKDITGTSVSRITKELKRGNPIVFEGSFQMKNSDSSHVLVAVGYRKGQMLIADPYRYKSDNNKVFWVDTDQFTQIYNKRSKLALVIY